MEQGKKYTDEEVMEAFNQLICMVNTEFFSFKTAYFSLPEKLRPKEVLDKMQIPTLFGYVIAEKNGKNVKWGEANILDMTNMYEFILYILYGVKDRLKEMQVFDHLVMEINSFVERYIAPHASHRAKK